MDRARLRPLIIGGQALLIAAVVAWVLNLPFILGLPLFTEQFLIFCLGLTFFLVFLVYPTMPRRPDRLLALDLVLALAGLSACWYVAVRYPALVTELVFRPLDGVIVATTIVVLVVEATRRTIGMTLVVLLLALCTYAMLGWMLPGDFATRPVQITRLMVYLGIDTNALLGTTMQIALIVVVPFILMGQILDRCRGGDFFTDLSMVMMGRYRGGAAKIAVVGSAFFGTVSGSAVANVVSMGMITIGLMRQTGFHPRTAAAVEAVSSTGGQLVPPVMGAAAFLMAEYLQVPYSDVMVAAIVPALLFYVALIIQVDLEAAKHGIRGTTQTEGRTVLSVLREGWHFLVPFGFLFVALIQFNMAAEYAALIATLLQAVLGMVVPYKGQRLSFAQAVDAAVSTGKAVLDLIVISAAAALLIGVLNLTGLAFGLTNVLLGIGSGDLLVLLLVSALIAIVLGMGLPTVGVYVIMATLVAPALIKAGLSPMQAHMFVLYFGMLSMITPPVALAAFAAANIAKTDPWATGLTSVRVGWSVFVIPFLFALSPGLLLDGPVGMAALAIASTLFGIYLGSAAMIGHMLVPLSPVRRLLWGAAALALLLPADAVPGGVAINLAAGVAGAALIAMEVIRARGAGRPSRSGPRMGG
jgi:TRAP transporter 4TM/12TM fusion protein